MKAAAYIRITGIIILPCLLYHSCNKEPELFDPDSDEKAILEFSIPEIILEAPVNEANKTIEFTVPASVNLQEMKPEILVSAGAVINPPSGQVVDLSQPFEYTVTAPNASFQSYTVLTQQLTDTAFLIIDVQNGWALDAYNSDSVFQNINLLADRARAASVPVIYVYDYSDQNVNRYTGWEMQIADAIRPREGDRIIGKRDVLDVLDKSTKVQPTLNSLEVGVVILSGMTSGACVNSSCEGALKRGYTVIIASDCHSANTANIGNPSIWIEQYNELWEGLGAVVMKARDIYF